MNLTRQQAVHNGDMHSRDQAVAEPLIRLLERGQLFTASTGKSLSGGERHQRSTGHSQLNALLGGGLSVGHLHEVQLPQCFVGESQLIRSPILAAEQHQQPVFWLNPPAQPCLAGLRSLSTQHYVLSDLDEAQVKWAGVQILQSLQAGVVLIWHPSPCVQTVRLWQRAMQSSSQCFALVFSGYMSPEARAYHTRLRIHGEPHRYYFDIVKRQGGWPTRTEAISLSAMGA